MYSRFNCTTTPIYKYSVNGLEYTLSKKYKASKCNYIKKYDLQ